MPRYTQDVRELIVRLIENGDLTAEEASEQTGASRSTVFDWLRRKRETGSCANVPRVYGQPRVLAAVQDEIRALVKAQPDLSLDELSAAIEAKTGVHSNRSMMFREVELLDLPRKKSRSTTVNGRRPRSNKRARTLLRSKKPT